MGSDTCKLRGPESPVRIDIGVSWREIEEARVETENINEEENEINRENANTDVDDRKIVYERVIPVNLTTGGHNERFENPVHGRNTPAVAQWTIGRSNISIHTSLEEGVGEKEKD